MLIKRSQELLLVGLDNPQSTDPRYALYHYPSGCAGWRLCHQIIGVADKFWTEAKYARIAKTNLFPVGSASSCPKLMATHVGEFLRWQLRDHRRRVVLLGNVVRDIVMPNRDEGAMEWAQLHESETTRYCWIPHPSGRNHFYNSHVNCVKVGKFLRELV